MGKIDLMWPSLAKLTPLRPSNVANTWASRQDPGQKHGPGALRLSGKAQCVALSFLWRGMAGRQRPHWESDNMTSWGSFNTFTLRARQKLWGKPSSHCFPQITCGILDYRQWWFSLLLLRISGNHEATRKVSKLGGLVFKFDININQILKLASCFQIHVRSLWKFGTPPPPKKNNLVKLLNITS